MFLELCTSRVFLDWIKSSWVNGFCWEGLEQNRSLFLPSEFSWNTAFDNSWCVPLPLSDLCLLLKSFYFG